jgi:Tetratricopeptide repeat
VGLAKLKEMQPESAVVAELRARIESDTVSAAPQPEPFEVVTAEGQSEPEEFTIEETLPALESHPAYENEQAKPQVPVFPVPASAAGQPKEFMLEAAASPAEGFTPPSPWPGAIPQEAPPPAANSLGDFVNDLESSLGDSFLSSAPPAVPETRAQEVPVCDSPAAQPPIAASVLPESAMASTMAAASGAAQDSPAFTAAFSYQPRPLASANGDSGPKVDSTLGVDLVGMFGELRQELEADTHAEEDCETHYNLGVAFREMGLLDEAIGEFQKVCQAADHGQKFSQLMQAYTWLAQCFLDKGVPEAAVRWYERALGLPGLDGETRVALHYELASSYEAAHNKPAALNHFLEVYGSNIDYRDVAERIQALKS